jgi:hypothetical protein
MNEHREGRPRWAIALFVILMASVVGFVAFRMGVTHGVALTMDAGPGESVEAGRQVLHPHLYAYPWHGPWGFGPFGLVVPFLFIGMWFFALRLLFWGGGGHHRRWHGARGGPPHMSRRFEEWHRLEHERMRDREQHDRSGRNDPNDSAPPRPPTA